MRFFQGPMNTVSQLVFRLASQSLAVLLAVQCLWLVLPEMLRPAVDWLPSNAAASAARTAARTPAAWAATIGIIRGDLWAASAFTYSDLLWDRAVSDADVPQALDRAHWLLDRALSDAPHQSSVWLFRAALGLRYPANKIDVVESLRMSYYTGPSEHQLMPLRLRAIAQLDISGDSEMRQFASRDLRFLVTRKQISAITEAYGSASPAGKRFIEQGVRDIDPAMVQSLQSAATGR
jgi:hypothetical protein